MKLSNGSRATWALITVALLAGGLSATSTVRVEEPHFGSFAAVRKVGNQSLEALILRVENRGGAAQVTGEGVFDGKVESTVSGTYYPRSKELRLNAKEVTGERRTRSVDGRFIAENQSYELWNPDRPDRKTILYPFTLKQVEGYYEGDQLRLSIAPKSGGFEVVGTYYGASVKGSYLAKSNLIAARIGNSSNPEAVTKVNGHYDPATGKLMIFIVGATSTDAKFFELNKRLGGAPPVRLVPPAVVSLNPGDPAAKPGAVWKQREKYLSTIGGTWTLQPDGRTFVARWNNGAEATLTLTSISATAVVVSREDKAGVSKGLKATYKGTRVGKKIEGTVDWTWADGKKGKGTWSADLPD